MLPQDREEKSMEEVEITRKLAEFVVSTRYKDLPGEAVEAAKMMILDTLGVGVGAYVTSKQEVDPVVKVAEDIGGKEESTVIVSGRKTSWFNAIFINGTFMHSLDYDDTRPGLFIHTGAVVVPSVLALCEKLGNSGKEAILAAVVGHEVIFRIASSVMPTHYRFWHSMGTNGTLGASAVAGKLLGLNLDEMEKALGIAADQASGLVSSVEGNLTKSLHGGLTSAKGVLSAMLAKYGATGPKGILENPRGYCNAYSEKPDLRRIILDLGKSFDIVNNCPKFYPSILCSHCAIQATLRIVMEYNLWPDDVVSIKEKIYRVPVPATAFENRKLDTPLEARLNHPYCIAVSILDREVGIRQFEHRRLEDPIIKELMGKYSMEVDSRLDEFYHRYESDMRPVRIEITTKNGQTYSAEEYYPKGFPKNPISEEELKVKFETLCSFAFEKTRIERLWKTVKQIESLTDLSELMSLLANR
jgi:2-methylcitrate dehydratase PrpD